MKKLTTKSLIYISIILASGSAYAEECNCGLKEADSPLATQENFLNSRGKMNNIYTQAPANACDDFYASACTPEAPIDPTGFVRIGLETLQDNSFFQTDANKLREFKAEWEKMDPSIRPEKLEKYVIDQFYLNEDLESKFKRIDQILEKVKSDVLNFYKNNTDKTTLDNVTRILSMVRVNRNFYYDPDLLFRNEIRAGGYQIVIGGTFVRTVQSEFALYFNLSHEVGHILLDEGNDYLAPVKKCFADQYGSLIFYQNVPVDLEEIWADWFAHQIFADHLGLKNLNLKQRTDATKNALRFLCGYTGSKYGHPSAKFRMKFATENPKIQSLVCPQKKAEPTYCSF